MSQTTLRRPTCCTTSTRCVWRSTRCRQSSASSCRTCLEIHRRLLTRHRCERFAGVVRTEQNSIGGRSYNPCSAAFVPPPPSDLWHVPHRPLRTVNYPAPDLAAAKAWWTAALGIDRVLRRALLRRLRGRGYELGLTPACRPERGVMTYWAWRTPDAALAHLLERRPADAARSGHRGRRGDRGLGAVARHACRRDRGGRSQNPHFAVAGRQRGSVRATRQAPIASGSSSHSASEVPTRAHWVAGQRLLEQRRHRARLVQPARRVLQRRDRARAPPTRSAGRSRGRSPAPTRAGPRRTRRPAIIGMATENRAWPHSAAVIFHRRRRTRRC